MPSYGWYIKRTYREATLRKAGCNDVAMSFSPPATGADGVPDGNDGALVDGEPRGSGEGGDRRLLVISHPAVVSVNQEVYRELARRGWDVQIVLPDRWRHSYAEGEIAPQALPGMERALRPTRIAFPGRP